MQPPLPGTVTLPASWGLDKVLFYFPPFLSGTARSQLPVKDFKAGSGIFPVNLQQILLQTQPEALFWLELRKMIEIKPVGGGPMPKALLLLPTSSEASGSTHPEDKYLSEVLSERGVCVCRFSTWKPLKAVWEKGLGCHTHEPCETQVSHPRFQCALPTQHPFLKGEKEGGQRALACPRSAYGRRWAGIPSAHSKTPWHPTDLQVFTHCAPAVCW